MGDLGPMPETFAVAPRNDMSGGVYCVYCREPTGGTHKPGCVMRKQRVRVRMIAEYDIEVPENWTAENVLFHRNEGTWCTDNALHELQALIDDESCLCDRVRFEVVAMGEVVDASATETRQVTSG